MLNFSNKKEIFTYIKKKFSKQSKLILMRGSTALNRPKKFSDFDIEAYKNKPKKPYYEIALLKQKPILLSVYFYKYKKGKKLKKPKNTKIIFGTYNKSVEKDFNAQKHFAKDSYTKKEKTKRECQLVTDFLFKYLRSKNKKYLEFVQKRIKD